MVYFTHEYIVLLSDEPPLLLSFSILLTPYYSIVFNLFHYAIPILRCSAFQYHSLFTLLYSLTSSQSHYYKRVQLLLQMLIYIIIYVFVYTFIF
jgi:hypothetical protein